MVELVDQPYTCVHCNKKFMQERTVVAHMCERKRRHLQKDEKRVQAGFLAFNRFWQLTQNAKKLKTYDEFADSSFYNAFVKFGSFINNINALYPDQYIDFLIKNGKKLDHWCRESLYEEYLVDILKKEPVESAIQRTLKTMMEWADQQGTAFEHYFRYANPNRVVRDVRLGNISCWVLLNCDDGNKMLSSMNDEQLLMISEVCDFKFWLSKFKSRPADAALVQEVLKEIGAA